jgi:hypothetical protein
MSISLQATATSRTTQNRSANLLRLHCLWKRKTILSQDWDWWTIHTGGEGTGKSTAAIWNCLYTDPSFLGDWRNRIAYDAETLLRLVDHVPKGSSILLDEAAEVWYYKEWADEVHRALDKMSIQVRDRNLDIHLASPSLIYVGKLAIRRAKDWCSVEAPGFVRGHLEVLKPHWSKFGTKKTPYWETRFFHRFGALPPVFYDQYRIFKRKAGEGRIESYIGDITHEPKKSNKEVVDEVLRKLKRRKDIGRFRNNRGAIDHTLVMYEYQVSQDVARATSKVYAAWEKKVKAEAEDDDEALAEIEKEEKDEDEDVEEKV